MNRWYQSIRLICWLHFQESNSLTISQLLEWANQQLVATSDTPQLDARLLFRYLSRLSDVELITLSEKTVAADMVLAFKKLIENRKNGMPVAYLAGSKEFWSLEFKVTEDTLIPRPETELLVESALALIGRDDDCNLLDLGTGTGAIAIALASERPESTVIATDACAAALLVAKENIQHLKVTNVTLIQSDWFENISGQLFDLIVSNPPYVSVNDTHLNDEGIKFEPVTALVSGPDGLDDLKQIITQAKVYLKKDGWLLVEHGYDQCERVCELFQSGGFVNIENKKDLNHNPRVTLAQNNFRR